jgi:hypothetical protein
VLRACCPSWLIATLSCVFVLVLPERAKGQEAPEDRPEVPATWAVTPEGEVEPPETMPDAAAESGPLEPTPEAPSSAGSDAPRAIEEDPDLIIGPPLPQVDGPEGDAADEPKKPKVPKPGRRFRVYGRVMTGWEYRSRRPRSDQPGEASDRQRFFLRQMRVKAAGRLMKRIRLNASFDLADAINPEPEPQINYLRNAHLTLVAHEALRFRFGRFKRPFSRLELRRVNSIPVRGRGLSNARVVEELAWGDRGVGTMLYGRFGNRQLEWFLSATNPGLRVEGVDVHARVTYEPIRQISVGANGASKTVEDPGDPTGSLVSAWAYGADARLHVGTLYAAVEGYAGQDYRIADRPSAGGVVGYVSVDIPLASDWALQPVVLGEWADANLNVSQSEAGRLVLGLNVLWPPAVRILPQVEIVRPLGSGAATNPWLERETYYVMVTGEL